MILACFIIIDGFIDKQKNTCPFNKKNGAKKSPHLIKKTFKNFNCARDNHIHQVEASGDGLLSTQTLSTG